MLRLLVIQGELGLAGTKNCRNETGEKGERETLPATGGEEMHRFGSLGIICEVFLKTPWFGPWALLNYFKLVLKAPELR